MSSTEEKPSIISVTEEALQNAIRRAYARGADDVIMARPMTPPNWTDIFLLTEFST